MEIRCFSFDISMKGKKVTSYFIIFSPGFLILKYSHMSIEILIFKIDTIHKLSKPRETMISRDFMVLRRFDKPN